MPSPSRRWLARCGKTNTAPWSTRHGAVFSAQGRCEHASRSPGHTQLQGSGRNSAPVGGTPPQRSIGAIAQTRAALAALRASHCRIGASLCIWHSTRPFRWTKGTKGRVRGRAVEPAQDSVHKMSERPRARTLTFPPAAPACCASTRPRLPARALGSRTRLTFRECQRRGLAERLVQAPQIGDDRLA